MEVITRRKKHKTSLLRSLFRFILIVSILMMSGVVTLLLYTKAQGPPPLQVAQTTRYFGADDSIIGEHSAGQKRYWISLEDIAPDLINATLSIEDRKFYTHYGFDPTRIGGAVVANIRAGSMAQGASTITQQYARNLYLGHDKTWQRKWNEALYALRLEMSYSKEDILEGYLNTIYYGHGAYGIEAAAQHFFGKSASDISLAESSMLAGIPKGPSYYSPLNDFERAKQRQRVILQSMADSGLITQSEASRAAEDPLQFVNEETQSASYVGPYFQQAVNHILKSEYDIDEEIVEMGGLQIYTTLDPELQQLAEKWVQAEIGSIDDLQTSLIAMDPDTGDVLALIGGRDFSESSFNRATQAKRQPGSTFKPFLYYAALEKGFTPTSTLLSEPTSFQYEEGKDPYTPSNFNDNYANEFITLLQALAFSDNIYAVKTHLYLGTHELLETAQRFGIKSPLRDNPALALGTSEVSMLEMVTSYSTFANGGKRIDPRFIRKVVDQEGNVLVDQEPIAIQEFDERLIFIMNDLMKGMFEPHLNDYASVTGGSVSHLVSRPVAGKSGSTPTDSWMIGYTPQLVTGVWIGFDEGPLNHSMHGQHAKRIWANFIEEASANSLKLQFHKPDGVTGAYINPSSGLLASEDCPVRRLTYFIDGTEPTEYCTKHTEDDVASEPIEEEEHVKERFLDRFFKWFH
ncbi:transglycosylase domain-containing protein [Bacillus alkalicellulosilyticus]|uniref:transglycosylase domain-containing protein n=1 Tax=Alkalihalobacterium alkalicellulosilyticum TaxID=1912214 RepID=UPI001116404C|nr:penicillin-binding protein 1A [Bacillus alkalicellulosilyticus]